MRGQDGGRQAGLAAADDHARDGAAEGWEENYLWMFLLNREDHFIYKFSSGI